MWWFLCISMCVSLSFELNFNKEEQTATESSFDSTTELPSLRHSYGHRLPCQNCGCGVRNQGGRVVGGSPSAVHGSPWLARLIYHKSFGCGASVINDRYVVSAAHCVRGVVGDSPSAVHGSPWMARLVYHKCYGCGASIIKDRYVVSAAHCVRGFMWFMFKVTFGEHDRCERLRRPETRYVLKIIAHNFTMKELTNDISLIQLSEPLTYSHSIRPVCLPTGPGNLYIGEKAIVAGWGATKEGGNWSCSPLEAELPVLSNEACQATNYNASKIREVMMCAGYPETAHKDACTGDSGGPLIRRNENFVYELIGVVSWGYGCARKGYPGVYARVTKYLDWIRDNTDDACYCQY